MSPFFLLFISILFSFFGIGLGIITGLIPGIHVNTIAFLLLSSLGAISLFVGETISGLDPMRSELLIMISLMVVGCVITHNSLDFIPSTFLGAPEGDTALSVLPAHEMLLEGKGYEAVKASALGSFAASLLALSLILPARLIMGNPVNLYEKIVPFIPLILFLVVLILILQEGRSLLDYRPKGVSLGIFLLSGLLGFILLTPTGLFSYNWTIVEQKGISTTSLLLFPLFTGLFGISNLLISLLDEPEVPEQETEEITINLDRKGKLRGIASGTFSGGLVGWLPGITAAAATAISRIAIPGRDRSEGERSREYIMAVSAVDTSCAIFTLVALFVIMKARSGSMQAVMKINKGTIQEWAHLTEIPGLFLLLLFGVVISSTIAYLLTLTIGKEFTDIHKKIEYNKITKGIIAFLILVIFILSGPMGLLVAAISTAIGVIPPLYGVKRVHLMGCIIFPIILFFTGLDVYLLGIVL